MSIMLTDSFTLVHCPTCGVPFAVPDVFITNRREDKATFYCPNGHTQSYRVSEADKLRAQLEESHRLLNQASNRQKALAEQLVKEQRATKRLSKRVESGVCPVVGCKRHFTNLQRHIATEHKGVVAIPAAEGMKQLPAGGAK